MNGPSGGSGIRVRPDRAPVGDREVFSALLAVELGHDEAVVAHGPSARGTRLDGVVHDDVDRNPRE